MDMHTYYLDELVNKLSKIGENKEDIRWIIKEGIWIKENSFSQYPLCDFISRGVDCA